MLQILQAWAVLQAALCLGVPPALVVTNRAGDAGQSLAVVVEEVLTARPASVRPPTSEERVAWARDTDKWWLDVDIRKVEARGDETRVELEAELRSPDGELRYAAEVAGVGTYAGDAACAAAKRLVEELGQQVRANVPGSAYDRTADARAWARPDDSVFSWLRYAVLASVIYLLV